MVKSESMTMHTLLDLPCQVTQLGSLQSIICITGFLQTLLKKGVKNIVVQGLPPTGCLPLAMTLAPVDDRDDLGRVKTLNNQSYTHTIVYQKTVQDLRKQIPDAVITYLDYWNAYSMVMKNPKKYGFKEPFMACCVSGGPPYNFEVFSTCGSSDASACPNPSQYINWEGVHLTEAMYKVLSRMFLSGTQSSSICFLEGQETARVNGS